MKINSLLVACLLAAACFPGAVRAQEEAPLTSSPVQVQGIVDRTVDGLWENTDHFWHDGDYNRILALCRVCVEADPSFNDAYASAAWLLWSLGDTLAADNLLKYGIAKTPDKGELYYEFGFHLFNTKRYQQAQPYLEKAVASPKPQPNWFATLGHSYRLQKKYDEAVQIWETVVEKYPNFVSGPPNLKRVRDLRAAAKRK